MAGPQLAMDHTLAWLLELANCLAEETGEAIRHLMTGAPQTGPRGLLADRMARGRPGQAGIGGTCAADVLRAGDACGLADRMARGRPGEAGIGGTRAADVLRAGDACGLRSREFSKGVMGGTGCSRATPEGAANGIVRLNSSDGLVWSTGGAYSIATGTSIEQSANHPGDVVPLRVADV